MSPMTLPVWLERPEAYAEYEPPPEAIGMTTRYELCFLESYARDLFAGAGTIVDLGCWFGATTAALARGLQANTRSTSNRLVEAFDLFRWEPWMTNHAHRLERLGRSYDDGDSFLSEVRELLRPYTDVVRLEERDLLEPGGPREVPIEFLFVDAQKSWALGQSIATSFFPSLMPGTSYVVHQDFAWYHPSILSIHLLMWYMRDHFQFVHQVPRSCSVVFHCTSSVDLAQGLPPPTLFNLEMIEAAYDWCFGCVEPDRLPYVQAAKLLFLLEREFRDEAVRVGDELLASDTPLPPDLVSGMSQVLASYRLRERAPHALDHAAAKRLELAIRSSN
jgi:hypothetical protein